MEDNNNLSISLAKVISKIANPTILSILFLLVIVWTQSTDLEMLIKWSATLFLFLVVLPLLYVSLRFYFYKSHTGQKINPTIILKYHPVDILILSISFGVPCLVILIFLAAPLPAIYTLTALLSCSLVVAIFNIYYRVSFHLAFITILIIMSIAIWGYYFIALSLLVPMIGWAKYRIHEHSMIQLISSVFLAGIISLGALYFF